MQIKFKKLHPDAVAPKQGTPGSAGFDLTVCRPVEQISPAHIRCWSGIAVEIPKGHVGLLFPRSSICKKGLLLTNAVGVIDSDYRGELMIALHNHGASAQSVSPGERVAQLVVAPVLVADFVEAESLSDTVRAAGGFGSTGEK